MSDYKPRTIGVILTYVLLPIALVMALFGVEEAQQELMYPFKIITPKVKQLINYLGSRI